MLRLRNKWNLEIIICVFYNYLLCNYGNSLRFYTKISKTQCWSIINFLYELITLWNLYLVNFVNKIKLESQNQIKKSNWKIKLKNKSINNITVERAILVICRKQNCKTFSASFILEKPKNSRKKEYVTEPKQRNVQYPKTKTSTPSKSYYL